MTRKIVKNKKGSTLLNEESIGLILSGIGIVFLLALATAGVFWFLNNQEKAKATSSLKGNHPGEGLINEIYRINDGGKPDSQGFLIPNPSDWFILGFNGKTKPNSCEETDCICICKPPPKYLFTQIDVGTQIRQCDTGGVCGIVFSKVKSFEPIKIEKAGIYLSIKKTGNSIEISKK
jgi:hypothetical protein